MCRSTVCIRLFAPGNRSLEVTSFSTANTTPSLTRRPIAVLRMLQRVRSRDIPSIVYRLICVFDLEQTSILKLDNVTGHHYRWENAVVKVVACTNGCLWELVSQFVDWKGTDHGTEFGNLTVSDWVEEVVESIGRRAITRKLGHVRVILLRKIDLGL